jgi:hypothetical protein
MLRPGNPLGLVVHRWLERRYQGMKGPALDALIAAGHNDCPREFTLLRGLVEEYGWDTVYAVVPIIVIDTVTASLPAADGRPVRLNFVNSDGPQDADTHPDREWVWAGRLLAARIAVDFDAFEALLSAPPPGPAGAASARADAPVRPGNDHRKADGDHMTVTCVICDRRLRRPTWAVCGLCRSVLTVPGGRPRRRARPGRRPDQLAGAAGAPVHRMEVVAP